MWGMWGAGMSVMTLIFWAAVILGIVALVRRPWGRGEDGFLLGFGKESPLDVAKRRYAAGEIGKEEFEQLKRDLA